MIHRLRDAGDFGKAISCEMNLPFHHAHDCRKLDEFIGFCRSQRVVFEERYDAADMIT